MAKCTQIANRLQAYVDSELHGSDHVILEQHIAECHDCRVQLASFQRTSAHLFETFSAVRLDRDLTQYVLEHLPEMGQSAIDVAGVNFRAKHPTRRRERLVRLVPIAAAVLLVFLAAVLNENWPPPAMAQGTIGIVAFSSGEVDKYENRSTVRHDAGVGTLWSHGDRFETGGKSALMLMLLGPTELRAAENTRVLVHDDRKLSLEKGHVFLDVAGSKQLFKVLTPMGEITVFGTRFDVRVGSERTTVIVEEGEVQLVSAADESVFTIIRRGQTASVSPGQTSIRPRDADIALATEWARHIVADDEARTLFASRIQPLHRTSQVSGRPGYIVDTLDKPVEAIILEWEPAKAFVEYADYEIFVYNDRSESLFRSRIDGSVFSNPGVTSYEIKNTGDKRENLTHIFVILVPDVADGKREFHIKDLIARIGT